MSDEADCGQTHGPTTESHDLGWLDYLDQSQAGSEQAVQQWLAAAKDPETRQQSIEALNESFDACMRSPAFLQAMKQHIDDVIRKQKSAETSPATTDAAASPNPDPREQHDGSSPCEAVYREGTLQLLRFRSAEAAAYAEPILICFALVNRPYILDLRDQRSVVQQLLRRGFDVYLIDWGTPTPDDAQLGLHDYVCRFIKNVVDHICHENAPHQLNLLGYCMGGTMSAMFTSLHPEQVRNLILLAAPIDFSGDRSLLNLWAREEVFDVDGLVDAYGNCPGFFLQSCFQLMKPATNFMEKYVALAEKLDNPAFVDNFLAMERWSHDSVPIAGKTFREFVKMLYQRNMLTSGDLQLNGTRVQLSRIACPVLLLVAEKDHLVPVEATQAIENHVSSTEVATMSVDAGHIGLAVSSKAHRQLWPDAADWIAEHSTPTTT